LLPQALRHRAIFLNEIETHKNAQPGWLGKADAAKDGGLRPVLYGFANQHYFI
jgi:hypothetical protein